MTQPECGYALHELDLRRAVPGDRGHPVPPPPGLGLAGCWAVMIASVGYAVTIAHYASALLRQSLIGVIVLPVVLLICAPYLLRRPRPWPPARGPCRAHAARAPAPVR